MEIKLQTGRKVQVETFKIEKTYAGLLIGKPNDVINEKIIDLVSHSNDWGNRKVFMKKMDMYESNNILKPVIYSVWLTSTGIPEKSKNKDVSSIVLLWFGEESITKSISEIIKDGVGDFDWDKHAENINL